MTSGKDFSLSDYLVATTQAVVMCGGFESSGALCFDYPNADSKKTGSPD